MTPSADGQALILDPLDIPEASYCGIFGILERHVLLQMFLRQQFKVKAQLFINLPRGSFAALE